MNNNSIFLQRTGVRNMNYLLHTMQLEDEKQRRHELQLSEWPSKP